MAYEYSERDLYDDADGDMYALFVLEDVTITVSNMDLTVRHIWLIRRVEGYK